LYTKVKGRRRRWSSIQVYHRQATSFHTMVFIPSLTLKMRTIPAGRSKRSTPPQNTEQDRSCWCDGGVQRRPLTPSTPQTPTHQHQWRAGPVDARSGARTTKAHPLSGSCPKRMPGWWRRCSNRRLTHSLALARRNRQRQPVHEPARGHCISMSVDVCKRDEVDGTSYRRLALSPTISAASSDTQGTGAKPPSSMKRR
jgi:hypothetical protein